MRLEANLLDLEALRREVPLFAGFYAGIEAEHPDARTQLKFNEALRRVIDYLVSDLITHTESHGPRVWRANRWGHSPVTHAAGPIQRCRAGKQRAT